MRPYEVVKGPSYTTPLNLHFPTDTPNRNQTKTTSMEQGNTELAKLVQTKIISILTTRPNSKYILSLRKIKKLLLEHPVPIVTRSQLISEIKGIGPKTAKLFDSYFHPRPSTSPLIPVLTNPSIPLDSNPFSSQHRLESNSGPSISPLSNGSHSAISFDAFSLPIYRSTSYAILMSLLEFSKGMNPLDALISRTGLLGFIPKYTMEVPTIDLEGNHWDRTCTSLLEYQWIQALPVGNKTYYCLTGKGREIAFHLASKYPFSNEEKEKDEKEEEKEEEENLFESIRTEPSRLFQKPTFYLTKPVDEPLKILLDTREHYSHDRTSFQRELALAGLQVSTRSLSLGDMVWVTGDEEVVNVIVERKRLDDLLRSVQEPRFQEQIWRLKHSDARVYYVLEKPTSSHALVPTVYEQSILASCQAQLCLHGFHVQMTTSISETVLFLKMLTQTLIQTSLPSEPYANFYTRTLKSSYLPLTSIYTRMLQTMKGMSLEKAQALVRTYPTLYALHTASDLDHYLLHQNEALGRKRIGPKLGSFVKTLMTENKYPS